MAGRLLVARPEPDRHEHQSRSRAALGSAGRGADPQGLGLAGPHRPARRHHRERGDRSVAEQIRLRSPGLRLSRGPTAPRQCDRAAQTYRWLGRCPVPRRRGSYYNGDRTKWLKLAYGMLALTLNHYSNKTTYDPARVIRLVDSSFASSADDALLAYPCTSTDFADCNFLGATRSNISLYRQTQVIVNLMNGTQLGGTVDPRMTRMLALDSENTTYRGVDVNASSGAPFGALTQAQRPRNFFGYTADGGLGLPSRYIFADRSKLPAMTYFELQFIKAEAALHAGDQATARTAYTNGITSHFQFVNDRSAEAGNPNAITTASRDSFLASPNIVPATLTLSHVM